MVTTKAIAPFGSCAKRFGAVTTHPNLDPSGLYSVRPKACDPCLYHPESDKSKRTKLSKDPWRYKVELEEWAQNLGYRNQKVLEYRKYQQSLLGAAWHTVPPPQKYEAACKNVGFGRTSRFRPSKNYIPGPGTYYKSKPFKAPYGPHSSRPTFDREDPCRFKDTTPKWSLAPDRYSILDKESIEQKSNKLVSLRGPYDLFTGKRDSSTINNRFSTAKVASATWPLALKGSFEKYNKSRFGTMNKTNMREPHRGRLAMMDLAMCIRKPDDPGPTAYTIEKQLRTFVQNKRPFNSTYDKGPGYQRVIVWPGVGRYSPSDGRCGLPGQGHRHVFLCKVQRTVGAIIPEPMNSF